jgi:uncharacterized protein with PIN domain
VICTPTGRLSLRARLQRAEQVRDTLVLNRIMRAASRAQVRPDAGLCPRCNAPLAQDTPNVVFCTDGDCEYSNNI